MSLTYGRKCLRCGKDIRPQKYKLAKYCSSNCREAFNEALRRAKRGENPTK
jgi:predicted nucleic acid-binding Zn ribbon protein